MRIGPSLSDNALFDLAGLSLDGQKRGTDS
jgi:hypothetical protein